MTTEGIQTEPFAHRHAETELRGYVVKPGGAGPFPTVIVMHNALGLGRQIEAVTARLAGLGYLAVATDMYGADADLSTDLTAGAYFARLVEQPDLLRARVVSWFETVRARADVDADRIAAIGYCFGGQCVLEMFRAGMPLRASVSYHGLLTTHAPAQAGRCQGEVAVYCGAKDPYAPPEHTALFRQEMVQAEALYHITEFGDAEHGFTDPDSAAIPHAGIAYHPVADRVSWAGTVGLLAATMGE